MKTNVYKLKMMQQQLFVLFFTLSSSCWALNVGPVHRRDFIDSVTKASIFGGVASVCSVTDSSPLGRFIVPVANAATALDAATSAIPPTGAKAPSFELPNSRGTGITSLNKLIESGKWTILYFYPGAFTTGCTMEARNFQRDIDSYRELNAQIVGVSVDPPEKNAQFCTAEGLDFYMLSDTGGRVSKLYGSSISIPGFGSFSNRQTYIIDPSGNLRWIFTDVESHIPRHSTEVIEKLKELESANA